ncbi:MAG: hypothetical protein GC155_08820 [Alphaproteobacteria bacterium]|nr:hypothetical protein [Alphaproteobacteria bacterium]
MRIRSGLIFMAAALLAAPAFGQKVERVTATARAANSPVTRDDPAMASGFSPVVASQMLDSICKPARDQLKSAEKLARAGGLAPVPDPAALRWALPAGAQVWRVESIDSEVYVYAYGSRMTQCGVAILRPLRDAIAMKLGDEMTDASRGYAVESRQTLDAGVKFTRYKAAGFKYADLMEYPANGATPGLVKIELLPLS